MTAPEFNDGQTSQDPIAPQSTVPDVGTETDYNDYLAWKTSQKADSTVHTDSDRAGSQVTADQNVQSYTPAPNVVDNGRSVSPTKAVKQDLPPNQEEQEEKPQSYIWLNDGQTLLVDDEDLPAHAGGTAEYGYWQQNDKVYQIVAVYPRETTVKGYEK